MDKAKKSNTCQYEYADNIVEVERHFANNIHINEILKKYIIENQKPFALPDFGKKCYNGQSNTTVVDFSERGSK